MDLEREIKEHGVQVVCSKMDTIVSMRVRGASGSSLLNTLRLMDKCGCFILTIVISLLYGDPGYVYLLPI